MSLHLPLYCCICSAPCLLPRVETPVPREDTIPLDGSDTIDSPLPAAASPVEPNDNRPNWLAQWHVLKVTSGLLTQFHISPSSSTLAARNETLYTSDSSRAGTSLKGRCVSLHDYCLQKVQMTVRRSMYNTGFSHEGNMMLGWSIPKWTGYGLWVHPADRGQAAMTEEAFLERGWVGYWGGTVSQQQRYNGMPESHLLPYDYVSPVDIAPPTPPTTVHPADCARPAQTSKLLALPSHILTQIALELVDDPLLDQASTTNIQFAKTKLIDESGVASFLAFLNTCSELRQLDIPNALWRLLTLHQVHRWKLSLLGRWRANPTGTGSASQLWISLDEEFSDPVEKALSDAKYTGHDCGADFGLRDVFYWWSYDLGWRSRRRVWHSVVHACATARDADWW